MNLFEKAVRTKLRFKTVRGEISAENLFDIPLTSETSPGFTLDQIAKDVKRELDKSAEESFVSTKVNPAKADNELRLEILKFVIAEKIELQKRASQAAANNERRRLLLQALDEKNRQALEGMSKEQIEAELSAIDNEA